MRPQMLLEILDTMVSSARPTIARSHVPGGGTTTGIWALVMTKPRRPQTFPSVS